MMNLIACPDCDLLIKKIPLQQGKKHQCPRCNAVLSKSYRYSLQSVLACALTGLILYPFAISQPLLSLDAIGMIQTGNLFEGVKVLYHTEYYLVAIILLLTTIIVPFFELSLLCYISLVIHFKYRSPFSLWLFLLYNHLEEWGMIEIYMLGILISVIKLGAIATLSLNLGMFCFIGLMLMTLLSALLLDEEFYWHQLGEINA